LAGASEAGSDARAAEFQRAVTGPAWAGRQNSGCRNTKALSRRSGQSFPVFRVAWRRGGGQGILQQWRLRKFGARNMERFGSNRTSQSGRFYFRLRSSNCASASTPSRQQQACWGPRPAAAWYRAKRRALRHDSSRGLILDRCHANSRRDGDSGLRQHGTARRAGLYFRGLKQQCGSCYRTPASAGLQAVRSG
jgi:hypothetical protein